MHTYKLIALITGFRNSIIHVNMYIHVHFISEAHVQVVLLELMLNRANWKQELEFKDHVPVPVHFMYAYHSSRY